MNVDEVRTLRLAAELGSFSKAAEYLNVSQPAVSQRIRHLETELGMELFTRSGRRVRLSAAGSVLLDFAHDLDALLADLRQRLESVIPESRSVVVGASASTAGWILPALYASFYEREPLGNVRTVVLPPLQVRTGVEHGDLDFGVVAGGHVADELVQETLLDDRLFLVSAPGNPLARAGRPPTADELSAQAYVSAIPGTQTRRLLDEWGRRHGVVPRVVLEADSHDALASAVKAGIGIGFVLETSIAAAVADGELVILDVPSAPLALPLSVIYHSERQLSGPAEALLETLRSHVWERHVPRISQPSRPDPDRCSPPSALV